MTSLSHKTCNKCKIEKPISEFGELPSSRDGHKYRCESCIRDFRIKQAGKSNRVSRRMRALARDSGVFYVRPSFLNRLYNSPCVICGSTSRIEQDHIIPINKGGSHSEGNLQPLCKTCNASKQDKFMMEFLLFRHKLLR